MRKPVGRLLCALAVLAAALPAQGRREGGRGPGLSELPMINLPYDGRFTFARIRYASGGGVFSRDRNPWAHDFPHAEANFTQILSEVTTVGARVGASSVITLDDPALFDHPIAYIVEVGLWAPSESEVLALRRWLGRGGFLIVDDFEGRDWFNFEHQMAKVLPGSRLQPIPPEHPIFDSFYRITSFDQVRHPYSGRQTTFWGIYEGNDPTARLMLVANRDGDIAEFWEYSDQGFFPMDRSNDAYKLGINYLVYALTR